MKKLYLFTLFATFFIISSDVPDNDEEEMMIWSNDNIVYYIEVKPKRSKSVSCDGLTECNVWEVDAYVKNISKDKIMTPGSIFFGPNQIGFESCSFNNQECIDTFEIKDDPKSLKPGKSQKIASWTIYSINTMPSKAEFVQVFENPQEETHFTVLSKQ